jgi:hypothetical protein
VKLREVVPFSGMLDTPKLLAMIAGSGGGATVRLAVLLAAPDPLSLAVIGSVVLFSIPKATGANTFTVIEHVPAAGFVTGISKRSGRKGGAGANVPPERLIDSEPGVAVTIPPQVLLSSLGEAITRPAGKLSVNEIPFSVMFMFGSSFGLLIVKLNKVVPLGATVSGRKSLLMAGGINGFTVTVTAAEGGLVQPLVVTVTE